MGEIIHKLQVRQYLISNRNGGGYMQTTGDGVIYYR